MRDTRLVTQRALADLAGASQAAVARVERGDRMPSIPLVERLLAALDLQLSVAVEPLDAHLDARMAELAARSLADQIDALGATRPGSAPG
ncbi:helix-turn-helix domain-containing protein [Micromonospora inositola]|uniref:helix-turn-helix domain-containing protein n=1 Tax=Micromonospora inositola TaxID=47865 RepID=UPI001E61D655|nr:helix-turn-helix transcriptional regulator [Micromonospora inositola]